MLRTLLATFGILIAAGVGLTLLKFAPEESSGPSTVTVYRPPTEGAWRRTPRGWVDVGTWEWPEPQRTKPVARLHPLVVAGLQVLASIGILLFFARPDALARPRRTE